MHTPSTQLHTTRTLTGQHTHTQGSLNGHTITILLNSGASCSVIAKPHVHHTQIKPMHTVRLINADGRDITPAGVAILTIDLGNFSAEHQFVVVDSLSTPVILGCDFLMGHGYVLDFQQCAFYRSQCPDEILQLRPEWKDPSQTCLPMFILPSHPPFKNLSPFFQLNEVTQSPHSMLLILVVLCPSKFRRIQFRSTILREFTSNSRQWPRKASTHQWPRCAPAVYVPKPSGEIRICVDYVQLNSVTKKDSYPLPRAEGPQQKLAVKTVFSKLDFRSAYWQFPMESQSIEKTAFCPGPGYGLWEFTRMPYGLTGAIQTCQRYLDNILKDCKDCVDNYVDDCIVFSNDMTTQINDLKGSLTNFQKLDSLYVALSAFLERTPPT